MPQNPSERLHELSMPSESFSSVDAQHALKLLPHKVIFVLCAMSLLLNIFSFHLHLLLHRFSPHLCFARFHLFGCSHCSLIAS